MSKKEKRAVSNNTETIKNNTLEEALREKNKKSLKSSDTNSETEKSIKAKKLKKIITIALIAVISAVVILYIILRMYAPEILTDILHNPLQAGKTIMTVDTHEVSSEEYLSYLMPAKKVFEDQYGPGIWSQSSELETRLLDSVEEYIMSQYALLKWAEEYGITVDGVTEEEFNEQKAKIVAQFGGEAGYKAALSELYTTEEVYDLQLKQDIVITKLSNAIAESDNSYFSVTDDEVRDYFDSNNMYAIKHILFSIADSSIDEIKKKAETSDTVLEEILNGADFDTMAKLYSEDQEQEDYTRGYVCALGAQEPVLEEAALSLGVGEIYPEVVIATYGYQIIMRIDPSYDLLHSELDDVILDSRVQNKKNEIIQSMTVEYCPNYDEITLSFIDYLSEK